MADSFLKQLGDKIKVKLDEKANVTDLSAHVSGVNNPHAVTKAQVGLGNVDNTSDMEKPVSNAMQNKLDEKSDTAHTHSFVNLTDKPTTITEYGLTDVYTKSEVDSAIASVASNEVASIVVTKVNQTTISVDGVNVSLSGGVAGKDYFIRKANGVVSISDTMGVDTIGGFHYSLVPHAEAPTGNKTEADMVKLRGINAYSIWTLWDRPICPDPRGKAKVGSRWYDIYLMDRDYGIRCYSAPTVHTGANIAGGATDNSRQIPKIPLAYGGNGTVTYGKYTWFQACEVATATGNQNISYNEFPTIAYGVVEGKDSSAYGDNGTIFHIPELMSKYGIEMATGTEWVWGSDVGGNYGTTDWAWRNNADARGQIYSTSNNPTAVLFGGHRTLGVNAGSRASGWYNGVWNSYWDVGSRFACDSLGHA